MTLVARAGVFLGIEIARFFCRVSGIIQQEYNNYRKHTLCLIAGVGLRQPQLRNQCCPRITPSRCQQIVIVCDSILKLMFFHQYRGGEFTVQWPRCAGLL